MYLSFYTPINTNLAADRNLIQIWQGNLGKILILLKRIVFYIFNIELHKYM